MKRLSRVFFILCFTLIALTNLSYAFPPDSLYNVPMHWKDDRGSEVELSDFAGDPVIVTMAFTTCASACPITIERLQKLDRELFDRGLKVDIVVVTFDAERDTPSSLAHYRKKRGLTSDHWKFLTGKPEDIRKLSLLLGINYQQDQKTKDFTHSNKLLLLTTDGVILRSVEGLSESTSTLVDAIEDLVPSKERGSEHSQRQDKVTKHNSEAEFSN